MQNHNNDNDPGTGFNHVQPPPGNLGHLTLRQNGFRGFPGLRTPRELVASHGSHASISTPAPRPPPSLAPQASPNTRAAPQGDIKQQTAETRRNMRIRLLQRLDTGIQQSGPTDEIQRSIELHRRLFLEDLALPVTREYLRAEEEKIEVAIIDVDTAVEGRKMAIPFFPGLLRQTTRPSNCRPCTVCFNNEEFSPDGESWARVHRGFGPHWLTGFLVFLLQSEVPCCRHNLDICRSCVKKHIQTQVDSQGRMAVDNIKCPSPGCQHIFTYDEIRRLAPADTFRAYDDHFTLKMLGEAPDFRWCLREGCGEGGWYGNRHQPLRAASDVRLMPCVLGCTTCPHCQYVTCYFCQVPWHEGMTCAEYKAKHAEESEATENWVKEHTTLCPTEGCGTKMEIHDGCVRAKCTKCRTEFCCKCKGQEEHDPRCRWTRLEQQARQQGNTNRNTNILVTNVARRRKRALNRR
ncbi:hypothetical protein F4801DRAFT_122375 [Xylaria longipes]|nr:hypothetical protein F4801DRAFT_122375 [Xylaria longipes]